MIGAGAAKTGWFRMSLGGEGEEEEGLNEATTQGRNVGLVVVGVLTEEVRQEALIEAVDIVQETLDLARFIV